MKYMGSKSRIAENILPIILKDRQAGQWYVEPFCGGCNTIDKVGGNRIASDANPYLIAMWQGLQRGNRYPHVISKLLYIGMRDAFNKGRLDMADMIGWVGFMGSFNGRFFDGGYSGHNVRVENGTRDYINESIVNIEKQLSLLKDVTFIHSDYRKLEIPPRSIIYCDPPYENVKQYVDEIDYQEFFEWCREKSKRGHKVFISSYHAPSDFKCVWSKRVTNTMHQTNTKKPIEKLFTIC